MSGRRFIDTRVSQRTVGLTLTLPPSIQCEDERKESGTTDREGGRGHPEGVRVSTVHHCMCQGKMTVFGR